VDVSDFKKLVGLRNIGLTEQEANQLGNEFSVSGTNLIDIGQL